MTAGHVPTGPALDVLGVFVAQGVSTARLSVLSGVPEATVIRLLRQRPVSVPAHTAEQLLALAGMPLLGPDDRLPSGPVRDRLQELARDASHESVASACGVPAYQVSRLLGPRSSVTVPRMFSDAVLAVLVLPVTLTGTTRTVPAGPAQEKVRRYLAAGQTGHAVAKTANIGESTVNTLLRKDRASISRATHDAIMALPEPGPPLSNAQVPSGAARTKVLALLATGTTSAVIARAAQVGYETVRRLGAADPQETVDAGRADRLLALPDVLPGTVRRVDPALTHAHVRRLVTEEHMSPTEFRRVTGLGEYLAVQLFRGISGPLRPKDEQTVLALTPEQVRGPWDPVPAGPAADHLRALAAVGVSTSRVAELTGLARSAVMGVVRGRATVTRDTADAVLGVPLDVPLGDRVPVPVLTVAVHIRALLDTEGQPVARLAEVSGVTSRSLIDILSGKNRTVTGVIAAAVLAVTPEMLARARRPTVDARPVREHLAALQAAGFTLKNIARVAGVSEPTVGLIAVGRQTVTTQRCAARILAVSPADVSPDRYLVDALGTVRRLRALAAVGWGTGDLAVRLGRASGTLPLNETAVLSSTAVAVETVYAALSETPGPDGRTARRAARLSWAPPGAWDPNRMDDPEYTPPGWPTAKDPLPVTIRRRQVAKMNRWNNTLEEIAARLGVTVGTVRKDLAWLQRAREAKQAKRRA